MRVRIGFSTSNGWLSRSIRWFLGAQVSHSYVRFHDEFLDADLIMHADWPGVIIEDAELFAKQNVIVEEFVIEDQKLKETIRNSLSLLRKKYDYWNIIGWAWAITFKRWVKQKIKAPIDDPKKIICVQFCTRILKPLVDIPKEELNPKSLREWMNKVYKAHGWEKYTYIGR